MKKWCETKVESNCRAGREVSHVEEMADVVGLANEGVYWPMNQYQFSWFSGLLNIFASLFQVINLFDLPASIWCSFSRPWVLTCQSRRKSATRCGSPTRIASGCLARSMVEGCQKNFGQEQYLACWGFGPRIGWVRGGSGLQAPAPDNALSGLSVEL